MADETKHRDLTGLGVYTVQEAAMYGRLSPQRLSRWLFGAGRYPPVVDSQLAAEHLVSFHDLVQAMAIGRARDENVSLQKVRQAIQKAKAEYGVALPLAHDHRLLLFDDELHIEFPNERVIQLTGRGHDQSMMRPIIEPFMKAIDFNEEGLAYRYTAGEWHGTKIVLDPMRQFGQPLVGDTGYRADVLAHAVEVEQSVDVVVTAYNIDRRDVEAAIAYMKELRKAA
ncbi:MAG: DUF433 domain-containing protein [Sedimentisphaerales bacterium]|nr:DUF433 domain-containing protein [Sedimentisphaerales bacterium]